MAEKTGRNGDGKRRWNVDLKLNVHVQYNMFAHFRIGAGVRMDLKLSEGIIRTT